jgi:hypothetical protein
MTTRNYRNAAERPAKARTAGGLLAALLAALVALPLAGFAAPAFAADDGAYLAATNTYYLNPDTGVTDDGGSRNAAIGEGMCRSVIYEKALVEIDGGKVYVTVRVQLVSNMGAIKFTVQQKPGDPASYASTSPRITAEDAGADTADYRFAVPAANSYIGCSTYVTPMGRDVKFYMNLSSDLTAGSADFVVSVKPKAEQTEPAADDAGASAQNPATKTQEAATATDTGDAAKTPVAAASGGETAGTPGAARDDANGTAGDETPVDVPGDAGNEGDKIATPTDAGNADAASAETTDISDAAEGAGETAASDAAGALDDADGADPAVTETSGGNGGGGETDDAAESARANADDPAESETTSSGPNSALFIALGVIAFIVIVGAIYIIRRKRNKI